MCSRGFVVGTLLLFSRFSGHRARGVAAFRGLEAHRLCTTLPDASKPHPLQSRPSPPACPSRPLRKVAASNPPSLPFIPQQQANLLLHHQTSGQTHQHKRHRQARVLATARLQKRWADASPTVCKAFCSSIMPPSPPTPWTLCWTTTRTKPLPGGEGRTSPSSSATSSSTVAASLPPSSSASASS